MVRNLRIAVLAAWLGAIVYFAIGVAPSVFAVLGGALAGLDLAGDIVRRALSILHYLGLACGTLFLLLGWRNFKGIAQALVLGMLLLTCVSQFAIMPSMHELLMKGRHYAVPLSGSDLEHFNQLHRYSTSLEVVILVLGIAALIIESRQRPAAND